MKHFLYNFQKTKPYRFILFVFAFAKLFALPSFAQETFPVNGSHDKRIEKYAFTNATVVVDHQTTIQNATLLIADGKIENVGANLPVPQGYITKDLKGKFVYPSLIDVYSNYGIELPKGGSNMPWFMSSEKFVSDKKGAYNWNEAVKPELDGSQIFVAEAKTAKELRELGFGVVNTHYQDGIVRGTGVLVSLNDGRENDLILKSNTALFLNFNKGKSTQAYPTSLMGSIALLRQTFLDGIWYKNNTNKKEFNISLEAWNKAQELPMIFESGGKLNSLRADKIGDEFGKQFIIRGSGDEYQNIAQFKASNATFILPVNYPDAMDVADPLDALNVPLRDMKHWELASTNPAAMAKAGIEFAFTPQGLKKMSDYLPNVRKAVENGLDKNLALKALTSAPAKIVKADNLVGSLKKGMFANFIITSKDLFEKDCSILENWIQGKGYTLKEDATDLRGDYSLTLGSEKMILKITGTLEKQDAKLFGKDTLEAKLEMKNGQITLNFPLSKKESDKKIRLSGWIKDRTWGGNGQDANGIWLAWAAEKTADFKEEAKKEEKKDEKKEEKKPELGVVTYPFLPYGFTELPKAQTFLVKNATVWTNEAEGVLENTDVLLKNGKIEKVGKDLTDPTATVIDGKGKHLSAGIIDEHSHIALNGVNEGVNSISAEVRMNDVINPDDVNIYRQLSGGVVAAQLLHGSSNPVGGQSALVKFRWGRSAEEMKIENADGFIKFALGENVIHDGWGSYGTNRFPQTRMGVEQVYADAFTRAREYEKAKAADPNTRKDLQMETLLEILNKKRFISCHSYVQSEINMLMKVAEKFNFRVNTFTHILEGYKVADKMKAHGAYASCFADWWAYKAEVANAIPYNAALMTKVGVVVAINSDDAEMARRLNQEAAKTVKYGGMTEQEALKMATLNPAKMLHLDNRMGSIKTGKDADVVLWSENPLAVTAKAEKTFIDGILYFDRERDTQLRLEIQKERNRLVQKMVLAKQGGAPAAKPVMKKEHFWDCEDVMIDEWKLINGELED